MHTRNELSSGSRCQVKPRCLMIHIYSESIRSYLMSVSPHVGYIKKHKTNMVI